MTDPGIDEKHQGRIREPIPTSGPLLFFDLNQEIQRLISERPWQAEHTANTIVKYSDLRIVLIALRTGAQLNEHRTAGRISIQSLAGTVRVNAGGNVIDLPPGNLLTLDRDVLHSVVALQDSVFLLTIAWANHDGKSGDGDQR